MTGIGVATREMPILARALAIQASTLEHFGETGAARALRRRSRLMTLLAPAARAEREVCAFRRCLGRNKEAVQS